MKKIKKLIDTLVSNILCLSKANKCILCQWKEVQLFSNCTFNIKKSEGLNLCSSLIRGAFLC